jgi:uncharacterized protein YacL (UPF0231 family)
VKIKGKINLVIGPKKFKKIRIKIDMKKIKTIFWFKDEIKKKIVTITKGLRKKNRNQHSEDQIEKHNTINLN